MPADLTLTSKDNLVIGAIRALLAYSSKISHLIETCGSESTVKSRFSYFTYFIILIRAVRNEKCRIKSRRHRLDSRFIFNKCASKKNVIPVYQCFGFCFYAQLFFENSNVTRKTKNQSRMQFRAVSIKHDHPMLQFSFARYQKN